LSGVALAVAFPSFGLPAGTPESQYPRGSPDWLFLLCCLSVAALGLPVPVFVVVLRNRRCYCRSVIVGGDSQAGRLRRAFLSVAASRFAV
jgi:hypothetical protein